ncbi:MAG: FAD-binding protein [Chloroflexi bacterium]|nr:MAG: FAD-binding protein [Chloroflexota bacterium]
MYSRVDNQAIYDLEAIVGKSSVLFEAEQLEPYSRDHVVGLKGNPEVVVLPQTPQQISAIFHLAQERRIPVTPRGAGYGLSGGAVPACGGIVMSLEKMDRILEIDKENLMVTVEPGVITGNIHRAVEAEGLFYPPDPASLDSCSIGGNIAENAGGPRAVKYGVTIDYVVGLEAVLPSGEILSFGGKLVKNVTGYNLIQLLVGSEGTLAVVTKIILKLIPLPKYRVDLLVPYNDFGDAAKTVSAIIASQILPTTIEFMEQDSLHAVEKLLDRKLPHREAAAQLLIQLDGSSQAALNEEFELVGDICLQHGARDVLVARDASARDRLWEARRKIIEALNYESPVNHLEDVVVPRAEIPILLAGIKELAVKHMVRIICFGHAGDGNVHVNVLKDSIPEDHWDELVPFISEEIYRLSLSLGGAITGEHGIGRTRRSFLSLALDPTQIAIMRQIKNIFDPNEILNPGKIFPDLR